MQSVRLALLAGAVLALGAAGAQAGDLEALNAQIDALDTSAVMPHGDPAQTPVLPATALERAASSGRAAEIGAQPAGGAAAGPAITWSGSVRTGVVYKSESRR